MTAVDVKPLRGMAGALGVSLAGLDDEQLADVAIRFVEADDLSSRALQRIVDDVREGGGTGVDEAPVLANSTTPPAPNPPRKERPGFRFNSTEADQRQRRKLAERHLAESRRTGLYLVPRRPKVLPAAKPHPACLAAVREGLMASVCQRCKWLLEDDSYTTAHMDDHD